MTSTILAAFLVSSAPVFTMATPMLQALLFQSSANPGNLCYFSNLRFSVIYLMSLMVYYMQLHHW